MNVDPARDAGLPEPKSWHRSIVLNEIKLLLEEYWFDNPAKADQLVEALL